MRTIRTKVFTFNELNENAIEVAVKQFSEINTNWNWHENTLSEFVAELNEKGFEDAEIFFSGFYSQGDGLCFDAKVNISHFAETVNEKRIVKLIEANWIENVEIEKTSNSNHYSHEKTRYITAYLNGYTNIDKVYTEFIEKIEATRLQLCKDFYKILANEYEYLCSSEAIAETIIANDYEFTIEGKLFNS